MAAASLSDSGTRTGTAPAVARLGIVSASGWHRGDSTPAATRVDPCAGGLATLTLGALPRCRTPWCGWLTVVWVCHREQVGVVPCAWAAPDIREWETVPAPPVCDWFSGFSKVTAWTLDRGGPRRPQGGGPFSAPHSWFTVWESRTVALRGPTRVAPTPPGESGGSTRRSGCELACPLPACACARVCVRPLGAHVFSV